jgi:dTDP-4-dehydrorhamnose reductase
VIAKADQNTFDWIHEHQGVYHLAGSGHISRCDWAKAILKYDPKRDEQITTTIQPAQTSDFPTPANRPLYSALNCDLFKNTFGFTLPPEYFEAEKLYKEAQTQEEKVASLEELRHPHSLQTISARCSLDFS